MTLFVLDADYETGDLYTRYGYLVNIDTTSHELIKNVMRLYLLGPSITYIKAAYNLILGLPIILEESETIISIDVYDGKYYIVTDYHVYVADEDALLRTDIGISSVLSQFDSLFENIVLYDVGDWWENFDVLDVPANIAGGDPLLIENKTVQLLNGAGRNEVIKCDDWFNFGTFNDSRDIFTLKVGMTAHSGEVIKCDDIRKDITLNVRNFFFGFIWKNSLYYFKIINKGIRNSDLIILHEVFNQIMPRHTYPLYYIFTPIDKETLSLSDVAELNKCLAPSGCTSSTHMIRIAPYFNHPTDKGAQSDQYNENVRSEPLTLADGYYGYLKIGGFKLGDPAAKLGEKCFTNKPLIKLS
jgi:hypothetical protein